MTRPGRWWSPGPSFFRRWISPADGTHGLTDSRTHALIPDPPKDLLTQRNRGTEGQRNRSSSVPSVPLCADSFAGSGISEDRTAPSARCSAARGDPPHARWLPIEASPLAPAPHDATTTTAARTAIRRAPARRDAVAIILTGIWFDSRRLQPRRSPSPFSLRTRRSRHNPIPESLSAKADSVMS